MRCFTIGDRRASGAQNSLFRKRRVIARHLMIDVCFLPIPWQELIEPVHGMAIGHALKDVLEIGEGLNVVEFCSGDERTNGGPPCAAIIGACEQVVLTPERNLPVILPISGKRSRSIIAGTRFLGVGSGCTAASSALLAALSISRQRPAWLSWPRLGCWIRSPALSWRLARRVRRYRRLLSCIIC